MWYCNCERWETKKEVENRGKKLEKERTVLFIGCLRMESILVCRGAASIAEQTARCTLVGQVSNFHIAIAMAARSMKHSKSILRAHMQLTGLCMHTPIQIHPFACKIKKSCSKNVRRVSQRKNVSQRICTHKKVHFSDRFV